jgi:hypothetical protein
MPHESKALRRAALYEGAQALDDRATRLAKATPLPADYDERDCGAEAGELYGTYHALREAAFTLRVMGDRT